MNPIQAIVDKVNEDFAVKSAVRDKTLQRSRQLIRYCANTIRAVHRGESDETNQLLAEADAIAKEMVQEALQFPDIYHAGYTQDALKELAEAHLTKALIWDLPLPTPQDLQIENAAYINGLAEAGGELRRFALDALRRNDVVTSERLLELMEDIYISLTTVDFPHAITGDLRRKTDMVRGVLERTRGDVTTAVRQEAMKKALATFEASLKEE